MKRVAVVLFNLGGPDSLDAVRPFLFNLFNDPAIIGAPAPVRWLLAQLISRRRAPVAQAIYAELGGGSPLLGNTETQARALERALGEEMGPAEARCFIAMRYWHPMTAETVAAVKAWQPDDVVLLPLYPQYSTSTTASSLRAWRRTAEKAGLAAPVRAVCCYPVLGGFIAALASQARDGLREAAKAGRPRVLFSAHGLPEKIVRRGDPYAWQVEQTAAAVVTALDGEDFDWVVCYQSRVGPLEWIRPYFEDELQRAADDGVPVVVVPIAFVSEHSETLVELDVEYRAQADARGVPAYVRTPTVDDDAAFIGGLAALVGQVLAGDAGLCSAADGRSCPPDFKSCAFDGFDDLQSGA
jgi:ferrochelatase